MYTIKSKIGVGAFGQIFKVERNTDHAVFALKFTQPKNVAERQDVINEASVIKHLNSPHLVACDSVYDY